MQPAYHRYFGKWGQAMDVYFATQDFTDVDDLYVGTGFAAADAKISKDGGAVASTTNTPAQITVTQPIYKLTLTATEMQAAEVFITIRDQTEPEVFEPVVIHVTNVLTLGAVDVDATSMTNTDAVRLRGVGTGDGLDATGGATGDGFNLLGGATSGSGIDTRAATSGAGIQAIGAGNAAAVNFLGGTGGTSGNGLAIQSGGATNAPALAITGDGSGAGVKIIPGLTGPGIDLNGGGTSGDALKITTTLGDGVLVAAAGTAKTSVNLGTVSPFYIRKGTAANGAAGSITLDAGASATDDFYNDHVALIIYGTGAGQARPISDYVGATKVASVGYAWATAPDNTSGFIVLPGPGVWDLLEGAEPTAGRTPWTAPGESFRLILKRLVNWFLFKKTATATTESHYKSDNTTVFATQALTDDGVTQTVDKQV